MRLQLGITKIKLVQIKEQALREEITRKDYSLETFAGMY